MHAGWNRLLHVLAALALLVGVNVVGPASSFAAEAPGVNDPATGNQEPATPEPGGYGRVASELAIGVAVVGGAFVVGFIAGEGLSSGLITAAAVGIIYSVMQ